MKWLSRIISIGLVLFLFGLTLKNTQQATLYFYGDTQFQGPLVVLLFLAFIIGCVACLLMMLPMLYRNFRSQSRQKKQISELELSNQQLQENFEVAQAQQEKPVDTVASEENVKQN